MSCQSFNNKYVGPGFRGYPTVLMFNDNKAWERRRLGGSKIEES
jgi:hypothetical protein